MHASSSTHRVGRIVFGNHDDFVVLLKHNARRVVSPMASTISSLVPTTATATAIARKSTSAAAAVSACATAPTRTRAH